jgi:hypothetical protein
MNTLEIFLAFVLILTAMFMAYPKRAKAATVCLTLLMGAMPLGKLFEAMIKYLSRNNKS